MEMELFSSRASQGDNWTIGVFLAAPRVLDRGHRQQGGAGGKVARRGGGAKVERAREDEADDEKASA